MHSPPAPPYNLALSLNREIQLNKLRFAAKKISSYSIHLHLLLAYIITTYVKIMYTAIKSVDRALNWEIWNIKHKGLK